MHSKLSHAKAMQLRNQGKSLSEIALALHIGKSTASLWLTGFANKGAFGTMSRSEWLSTIRAKSLVVRQKRALAKQELRAQNAKASILSFNPNLATKKAMMSMLYWAEGAKAGSKVVCFANTDPLLIKLFITLFRQCYPLDESKFRMRLHLHKYHGEQEAKLFWSRLTDIPESKIGKIYWKKEPNSGKRYRQNFMGICFVRYNNVELQRDIMAHAIALGEKLTK